ncbi:MAG TPA: NAD(P)H-hydrate dehydratase [Steroidobacteraceae bacterium]|nr:NAD(P)H-hydrate dehydratase [Steroidobacteraceae bacterium]
MDTLPAEVYSAASVRAMDRRAIEREGIPGYTLMERAGAAALDALRRHWPAARAIAVLCGAGNNAGDGYVVARLARAAGIDVRTAALGHPAKLAGDAARAHADFTAAGGRTVAFDDDVLAGADVVVDALLGIGLDRPVEGAYRSCIERVNRARRPVLAMDIPSGLHADTGVALGAAIRATRTLSFIALKSGQYLGDAPDCVGALELADLAVPPAVRDGEPPVLRRIDPALAASALPPRRRSAHKGDHGRLLVVGGFVMAGAARLAGEAAMRTGAGLVTIATAAQSLAPILEARPELIARVVESPADLEPLAKAADAVAVGPGLGTDARGRAMFEATLKLGRPLVVDADALTLLAGEPTRREDWILTPHPGEAGRLLGTDAAAVQRDRLGAVRAIASRYGGACVLKGARTLVQAGEGAALVCDRGNPGMATAGCGDALTGILAALVAEGTPPPLAAAAGAWVHATAGDRAARAGERGMIAGDLIAEIRAVVNAPWN